MSRKGKRPIAIPDGVKIEMTDHQITAAGKLGKLSLELSPEIRVSVDEKGRKILVEPATGSPAHQGIWGTVHALIANMVKGVQEGFVKSLEIVGVGYSAKKEGDKLILQVGFNHPIALAVPSGLTVELPTPTHITVKGVDKQRVGQFAANIRDVRPPEPYKGKGIRYLGETVRRKAGKGFAGGAPA